MAFENLEWQLIAKDEASDKFKKVEKAQDDLAKSSEKAAATGDKTASSWKNIAGGVFAGGVALGIAKSAFDALKNVMSDSIQEAQESQRVNAQLGAVLESTGYAAGFTKKELTDYAAELSHLTAIDDEAIISAEAMLATFTQIGGETFKTATMAVLDMATAMQGGGIPSMESLRSTAMQVGKALNDPVRGMVALTKAGVTFTESQKDMIETLTKAKKVTEAQKIITDELAKEFEGSAAAAAQTFEGRVAKLSNAFGDVKKNIGLAVISAINPYIESATEAAERTDQATQSAGGLTQTVYSMSKVLQGAYFTIKAVVVGGIGSFILALGEGIKVGYNFARDIIKNFQAVGDVGRNVFKALSQAIHGDFSQAWETLKTSIPFELSNTKSAVQSLEAVMGSAADKTTEMWNKSKAAFKEAFSLTEFKQNLIEMDKASQTLAASQKKIADITKQLMDPEGGNKGSEKVKDIQAAWEKVRDTFKDGGEKIGESIAKLEEDHSSSIKGMVDKMADLRKGFQDTVASYKESVADMNKTEAERFIDQEKKIADLKKQIATEQASGATSEDNSANQTRIAELQAQLQKEEAALTQYAQRAKDLEKEITEARRRSSQSDFANFEEDMAKKRAQLDAEHIKKLQDISTEVAQLELAAAEETVIYEAKKKQYNEVALQFQAFHNTYVKNLDDMKANTDKSVEAMNKKLQEMLAILAQIESAKNKAGILNATPGLGGAASSPSGSQAGNGAGGITVNFGDVHVSSQADIDALMAALARQLQLSGQGSH